MTSFNAAFKKWFGRSRVVDENGEPLVVYHGTDADFTEFRLTNEIGYHFGTEEAANERIKQVWGYKHPGVVIMPCYLSLQNPLRVADQGTWESAEVALELWDKGVIGEEQFEVYKHELDQEDLVKLLAAKGYDGLCYYNLVEHKGGRRVSARGPRFKPVPDSWIALHPSQIKSVFNTGTWSREDPDIRRNPDEVIPEYHMTIEKLDNGEWYISATDDNDQVIKEVLVTARSFLSAERKAKEIIDRHLWLEARKRTCGETGL